MFTYGFAYVLTPEGWQGYVKGRIPMKHQQKALIISTSLFREGGYRPLLERVMTVTVDEWALRQDSVTPRLNTFTLMGYRSLMMIPGEVILSGLTA